ncbi:lysozyme inhibitor LprI family protein [Telluria sp. Tellsp104]
MPNYLFNVQLTLLLSVLATTANAASFDCKLAQGKVEKMICADSGLSKLDEQLSAAYTQIVGMVSDKQSEKSMQRAWLRARNACTDIACLQHAYASRNSELRARLASPSPLVGIWKKEYSCDQLSGIYAERCKQGQRDKFQLSIVVQGDNVCALHVVWANMGNRVDEIEDLQPSMTGKTNGNTATIRFSSTWGGTGTATLRVQGSELHWKVSGKDEGESWIPDEAVLVRVPAVASDRMPECLR